MFAPLDVNHLDSIFRSSLQKEYPNLTKSYIEYIDIPSCKVVKYSEDVMLELNKLTAYTERIQMISQNNSEGLILNKKDVSIRDLFNRITGKYNNITDKEIDLNIDIQTKLETMNVDLLHISNVFDNLIENAIKYSKSILELKIKVTSPKETISIEIADNGIGIPKLEVNNIFEKYYRSSNVNTVSSLGFGLGLTYCKYFNDRH